MIINFNQLIIIKGKKFKFPFSKNFNMRIVRFSSPSAQTYNFQDQKISLSKLTQVRALATGQHKF